MQKRKRPKKISRIGLNIPDYPKTCWKETLSGFYSTLVGFKTIEIRFQKTNSKQYRKALYLTSLFPHHTLPSKKNNYWAEVFVDTEVEFYVYFDVLMATHSLISQWKYVENYVNYKICYSDELYLYLCKNKDFITFSDMDRIDIHSALHTFNDKWKNEKDLFIIVQNIFTEYTVERHYQSSWLEHLELDVYIEELKLGIEYQGIQHFKPIEHRGGEEGFVKRRLNDIRKKELCEANGVRLIYFTYQEEITDDLVIQRLLPYIEKEGD